MSVRYAAGSSTGIVREHNEDHFLALDLGRSRPLRTGDWASVDLFTSGAVLVVTDGVGGAAAGEVASHLATEAIASWTGRLDLTRDDLDPAGWLMDAIHAANRTIVDAASQQPGLRGMSSTLTAAVLIGDEAWVAQVGDSRAYLLRDHRMEQLTEDQTLVRDLVTRGLLTPEQARNHHQRNVILQVVGMEPAPEVALGVLRLRVQDRLLLCSDGVTDMLDDAEIQSILDGPDDPVAQCGALIRAANGRGGIDNITAVVAHIL